MIAFALALVFPVAMAFAAATDLLTMTIPNKISLALLAAFALAVPFTGITWQGLLIHHVAVGAAVLAAGIALFALGWMGGGDVKLMAMVGAFLGVKLTIFTLFSASLLGSLAGLSTILLVWIKRTQRRRKRNHESLPAARRRAWKSASVVYRYYEMPFGVFLGAMALVAVFFGDALIRWYVETYL